MAKSKDLFLKEMASKYRWWETSQEALLDPDRILAGVMNMGTIEDILKLRKLFDKTELLKVLQSAVIGQFNAKSWHYWYYCLTEIQIGQVPPLPEARIPSKGSNYENM